MTRADLARRIDHTLLKPTATQSEMARLCDEAVREGFAAVTVNPAWVTYCAKRVDGAGRPKVNAVVGFPLGATTARMKVEEAKEAVGNGATELDVVINLGALKSGFPKYIEQELAAVVTAAPTAAVKAILETGALTDAEKKVACEAARLAGCRYVKTSTGFGPGGATIEDVRLLRRFAGEHMRVKAAGGIRTYLDAVALLQAGASRLGTSAGLRILELIPHAAAS